MPAPDTINKPLRIFIPFAKVDEENRMVYGYASTEAMDSEGERVSKEAVEKAWPEYMKYGNIREMHQPKAAGRVQEAELREKGRYIGVEVVDDQAWAKVKKKVYNGFSIGGTKKERLGEWVTEIDINEISLVDRPANPEAVFDLWKRDGGGRTQKETKMAKGDLVSFEAGLTKMVNRVFILGKNFKYSDALKKGIGSAAHMLYQLEEMCRMRDGMKAEEAVEGGEGQLAELDESIANFAGVTAKYVVEQIEESTSKMTPIVVEDENANLSAMEDDMDKMAKAATALIERGEVFGKMQNPVEIVAESIAKGWEGMDSLRYQDEGERWTKGMKISDLRKGNGMEDEKNVAEKGAGGEGEGWVPFLRMMEDEKKTAMEGADGEEATQKMGEEYDTKIAAMKAAYAGEPMKEEKMEGDEKPVEKMAKIMARVKDSDTRRDDALAKVAGLQNDLTLAKTELAKSQAIVTELNGRLEPPKAQKMAIALSKSQDTGSEEVNTLAKRQETAEKNLDARELIKMTHEGTLVDVGQPLAKKE